MKPVTHSVRSVARPLVIDLFCGLELGKPKFRLSAYAAVQKFVARRAQNPDHVRASILNLSVGSIASMFRAMGEFYDSMLAARLASGGKVGVFTAKADHNAGVLKFSPGVVNFLNGRILPMESAALFLAHHARAIVRAIAPVAVWRDDIEMLSADLAVSSSTGYIALCSPSEAAGASLTSCSAIALIRSLRGKLNAARRAE